MTFKAGNFKVTITITKDGGIVVEIEPWIGKGGLTPPAHLPPLQKVVKNQVD